MNNPEKISSIVLCILGVVIVVDTILAQFFSIGEIQDNLVLPYCIAFVLLSIKYESILKKKYVVIPMYIMVLQTIYSLILKYL